MPKQIPCLSLTLGQQGGIGLPPVLILLKGKWYAIRDSRDVYPPKEIESLLVWQHQRTSPYDWKPMKYWHDQGWIYQRWHDNDTPRITWDEVVKIHK